MMISWLCYKVVEMKGMDLQLFVDKWKDAALVLSAKFFRQPPNNKLKTIPYSTRLINIDQVGVEPTTLVQPSTALPLYTFSS